MALSRDSIAKAPAPKPTAVDAPEWGGEILIRPLRMGEYLRIKPQLQGDGDVSIPLILASACDESGDLIFSPDDTAMLETQPSSVIQRIAVAIIELNRISATATEDTAKN